MTHIKTKSDQKAIDDGCTFQIKYAERVKRFCSQFVKLTMDEWFGKPLTFMPFQWNDIIAPLYAWRKPDGQRRFKQASIWLPKNNTKSMTSAAIALYELVCSGTQSGLLRVVANTIDEADTVFQYLADMVAQSPELNESLWVRDNIKTIEYSATRSKLKVISGEKLGKEGKPLSLVIYDELAWAKNREVFESLRANVNKRKNSLLINISTAGFNRESIGYEEFVKAEKIIAGKIIDTSTLPVIYQADYKEDWKDIETAKRCNPAWNVSVFPDSVADELNDAINEPRKESTYRTRRLNQWVGASTCWISSQRWAECGEDYNEQDFYGSEVYCGYDYGFKGDLASYCLTVKRDGLTFIIPRFFCPRKGAERKQEIDRVPYLHWASNPKYNLYLTDGDVIDPAFIRTKIMEDSKNFRIVECGYDPARGVEESRQILEQDGIQMVTVPQRPKYLGAAASFFERAVLSKQIRHPNNPVLSWCLENCATKETADGLFVTKGSGETQRIDGIIACLMALSRQIVSDMQGTPQFFLF